MHMKNKLIRRRDQWLRAGSRQSLLSVVWKWEAAHGRHSFLLDEWCNGGGGLHNLILKAEREVNCCGWLAVRTCSVDFECDYLFLLFQVSCTQPWFLSLACLISQLRKTKQIKHALCLLLLVVKQSTSRRIDHTRIREAMRSYADMYKQQEQQGHTRSGSHAYYSELSHTYATPSSSMYGGGGTGSAG